MKSKVLATSLVTFLAVAGCSSGSNNEGTGGNPGSGGQNQTGGVGSGGTASTGGATGKGGTTGTGGGATGGATGSGGSGKGGVGAGGAAGGSAGSTTSTGGHTASTGGNTAIGGATSPGGSTGSGRDGGPGGAGRGGNTGGGGVQGSGGAAGGGGISSTSNLPPAGASGQAAPSGSGTKVTVLDWAGFKSAISFTFDDSNSSQISNYSALQALNDKGNNVRYTFYLQTGKSDSSNAVWGTAKKDGHELGNHTKSHSSSASSGDIDAAESFIKSTWGVTSYSVAAPNGDSSYQSVVSGMKEFMTNRTAGNGGGIAMTDNPSSKQWALPCIIPSTGASASAMESSITSGTSGGKWNVFLVHGFSGGSDSAYQPVSISEFTSTVKWAKEQGTMWIDSVENVSAYWIAAYKFSKLSPTSSGGEQTWTWKTSDFNSPFPPGKFLRMKTDGGTLKQGSSTLKWDDHGYYEVSLDAGTLTLSP